VGCHVSNTDMFIYIVKVVVVNVVIFVVVELFSLVAGHMVELRLPEETNPTNTAIGPIRTRNLLFFSAVL